MIRVYEQRKVKHANCKNVKGSDWSVQTQFGDTEIFFIRGSDWWCYRTSTLMETSTHEG